MSYLKDITKKFTKSRFVAKIISFAAYWYIRLIAATTKWDIRNINNFYDNLEKYGSVIFIAWHGRVPMIPYFWDRRKTLKALVSPHRDGQMMVGLLQRFGIALQCQIAVDHPGCQRAVLLQLLIQLCARPA